MTDPLPGAERIDLRSVAAVVPGHRAVRGGRVRSVSATAVSFAVTGRNARDVMTLSTILRRARPARVWGYANAVRPRGRRRGGRPG